MTSNSTTNLSNLTLETIISLCKRRGFVFPTSEIYGGLASSYDYGPMGAELLRHIRNAWWDTFITFRSDMVGLDSQIMLNPQTWVASGHVASFTDPLVEDKITHERFRADHLIESWLEKNNRTDIVAEDMTLADMTEFIQTNKISSPAGNEITPPKNFNILFETAIGSVEDEKSTVYLRGETAQGIFTNFKQIIDSTRVQLPFGVGQIGKSFRNEITTGQFIFRTLELEQAEIEYFFNPAQQDWQKLMEEWKNTMWQFATQTLGLPENMLRWRKHTDKERSHYSKDTYDLEFLFPFGWKELWGIAYRTDYDLQQHSQHSGTNLSYTDPHTQQKMVPHVIEPALGVGRAFLATLCAAHQQEEKRTVLKLPAKLAPYKAAIFPLLKNKPELVDKAKQLHTQLQQKCKVAFDDRGNIGKRYLYQDEIGTPACITVDFQTLEDNTVTWRDRDTSSQTRVAITELEQRLVTMIG